ncbi:hypothetical protein V8E51_001446 [Hyaloscypha variabilis]
MLNATARVRGRQRFVNQVKKQLAATAAAATPSASNDDSDSDADDLQYVQPIGKGDMRLYSYFVPGLEEGRHTIDVTHNIDAPHQVKGSSAPVQTLPLSTHQEFEVYGPRYSLPQNSIHQSYPPQGHADYGEILPHIVFNDPHLPWERIVSSKDISPFTKPPPRNSTPWLALLVFTEDELRLSDTELGTVSQNGLFPDSPFKTPFPSLVGTQSKTTMKLTLPTRQAAMLDTWKPGVGNPPANRNIVTGIIRADDDDPNDRLIPKPDDGTEPIDPPTLDMVFVPTDVFSALFCSYDSKGMRQYPDQGIPDLTRYRYMAHSRQVNTQQMAGDAVEDEQGLFSIIISHRAGPLPGTPRAIPTPQTSFGGTPGTRPPVTLPHSVIVHLVSLEGIENYIRVPFTESRAGLVSLYSWTYSCLPPESVNFVDSMRAIGFNILTPDYSLKPPQALLGQLPVTGDPVAQRLQNRATDGFTLLRQFASTGEETAAFFRGALTPNQPPTPLNSNWPAQVNFSSGLDILDQQLGIMDITYSSAWELGRTMAMSDQSFTAALSRVRRATQKTAAASSKAAAMGDAFRTKKDILKRLPETVKFVSTLVDQKKAGKVSPSITALRQAPQKQSSEPADKSLAHPITRFASNAKSTMKKIASATPRFSVKDADPEPPPYNEYNIPQNEDWALIHKWIVDKMFLYNIPPQYLIVDPSHLPKESIRFFYIDPNWMNCLVDGALSIGNHLDEADDVVRAVMKNALNDYFKNPVDPVLQPNLPQIPRWGFFLRSAVVNAFPNLQIHAPWPAPSNPNNPETRLELLRNDVLNDDVLLCLLDRLPGAADLSEITISQPSHQQRYAVGTSLGPDSNGVNTLEFQFKRVYTTTPNNPEWSESLDIRTWKEGQGEVLIKTPLTPPNPSVIFDFDTNCMLVENFATTCNNVLDQELGSSFTDKDPSSALVGVQLNDPIQKMIVYCPQDPNGSVPTQANNTYYIPLPTVPDPPSDPYTPPNMRIDLPQIATPHTAGTITVNPNPPPPPAPSPSPPAPVPKSTATPTVSGFKTGWVQDGFISGQKGVHNIPAPPFTSETNLPIDLVIALNHNSLQDQTLYIWRIQVSLPKGDDAKHLLKAYDGTGAKMLSNQRFNVHGEASANYYNLYLIPRSTSQLVQVGKNADCSFIVNGIVVNGVVGGPVAVEVVTTYKVPGPPNTDASTWPDAGTSNQTIVLYKVAAS